MHVDNWLNTCSYHITRLQDENVTADELFENLNLMI
jgi:hypothetical protein